MRVESERNENDENDDNDEMRTLDTSPQNSFPRSSGLSSLTIHLPQGSFNGQGNEQNSGEHFEPPDLGKIATDGPVTKPI